MDSAIFIVLCFCYWVFGLLMSMPICGAENLPRDGNIYHIYITFIGGSIIIRYHIKSKFSTSICICTTLSDEVIIYTGTTALEGCKQANTITWMLWCK